MAETYFEMSQFIGLQLSQEWPDDYSDPYEAAEAGVQDLTDESLLTLDNEIERFHGNISEPLDRFRYFELNGAFEDPAAFDVWMLALRARVAQALSGSNSEPLRRRPCHG